jgi:hypothetical protein
VRCVAGAATNAKDKQASAAVAHVRQEIHATLNGGLIQAVRDLFYFI